MAYRDPAVWKRYKDAWYQQNKERVLATTAEKRRFMRELIDSAKAFPCADCDVQYPPYVMEFDHVRGEKVREVANFIRFFDLDKFFAEVEKCDVVCSNCHKERTHRRKEEAVCRTGTQSQKETQKSAVRLPGRLGSIRQRPAFHLCED